jgi:hypothetical protein
MAGTYLKVGTIANTAVGLLYRNLNVARTLWTDAVNPGEFTGALNDTVNMRVPARRTARTRTLRAGTPITNDSSVEFSVPVQLTTDVYNGAPITDEELTLDITDFGRQILNPQIKAVAEGVEDIAADAVELATYRSDMTINQDWTEFMVSGRTDWWRVAARAAKLLDIKNVPATDRFLLVGADVKEEIVTSDRFATFNSRGPQVNDVFTNRQVGTIADFTVVYSPSIGASAAYAYHRTAFVMATRAPLVPRGATAGVVRSAGSAATEGGAAGFYDGLSIRWLSDYDYTNTTDRSLVNTWVGTATVTDPDTPSNPASTKSLQRAVKISPAS